MTTGHAPRTLHDALFSAEAVKDRGYYFISGEDKQDFHSFHDMIGLARRRAAEFTKLGLKKGDRIVLIIPDNDQFVVSFLAATLAGILPVPLYPPLSLGKLKGYLNATGRIVRASGAKAVLTTKRVHSILWPIADDAPELEHLTTIEKISSKGEFTFEPATVGPDDPVFLQYTSGSTAEPKGVIVTHRSLVANCQGIVIDGTMAHPYNDKGLSWLPLYHDMGLIGFVLAPLFVPLSVILVSTLHFLKRPLTWMELIHKHRATITFAPNFAYSLMSRRATQAHFEKWDLSCLRVTGCGAEPISPDIMTTFLERFAAAGLPPTALVPCYGMAEATLAITFKELGTLWRTDRIDARTFQGEGRAVPAAGEEDVLEFVSCGKPITGHTVNILDEDGQPLPERSVGEIEFQGPSKTAGYFGDEKETHAAYSGEGLLTGDLGYLANGQLYVTGRKKDLIIFNGRNYVPQAVEWVVEEVPGVRRGNVVAFARPGESGTEELVIVCEIRGDEADTLRADIAKRIAEEFGLPVGEIVLLEPGTLPKTTSGKIRRRKTREKYIDGSLGTDGVRTQGQTGQMLSLTGHMMRAMISRVRHSVRRKRSSDD